jgi:DNA-directed RNA polymerase subunit beta'
LRHALRTADSGYLTRRLVDVSQDVIVTIPDCGVEQGLFVNRAELSDDDFRARVFGRVLAADLVDAEGEIVASRGALITDVEDGQEAVPTVHIDRVMAPEIEKVLVRTVMVCEATYGVCQACYGRNLASGRLVDSGDAVGVVAAQSIGEPGTQLTMRTFHTGGVARADITTGLPRVEELFEARNPKSSALLADREGVVSIEQTDNGRVLTISSTETTSGCTGWRRAGIRCWRRERPSSRTRRRSRSGRRSRSSSRKSMASSCSTTARSTSARSGRTRPSIRCRWRIRSSSQTGTGSCRASS